MFPTNHITIIQQSHAFPPSALAALLHPWHNQLRPSKASTPSTSTPHPPIAPLNPLSTSSKWLAAPPIPTRATRPRTSPLPAPAIAHRHSPEIARDPPHTTHNRTHPLSKATDADAALTDGTSAPGATPTKAAAAPAKASQPTP
jgi:hypothetical protein